MPRAQRSFGAAREFQSPDTKRRIEEAVREAEARTAVEIVPAVAPQSSRYQRAEDVMGLWCAFLAYLVLGLLSPEQLIDFWEGLIVLGFAVALGSFLAHFIAPIKRALAGNREMTEQVTDAAYRTFRTFGVGETAGRTGLLIYVSLFERVAVVLGDRALADKVKPEDYAAIRDALVAKMKAGDPVEGLIEAIRKAGEILAPVLPRAAGDRDEIPDTLRLLE